MANFHVSYTVSRQFAPDNSPPIFKQLAPRSFIHYRAKRAAKYMNLRLNVLQIILCSIIQYRTNYSSFFYPLPSLKIGGESSGANCPGGELSDILLHYPHVITVNNPMSIKVECAHYCDKST